MRTRAAIVRETGRPWEVTELDLDEPRAGEVRIRFAASGMCHSDEHLRTGDAAARLPMVGGHEGAGVVEAAGPGVTRVAEGDHVVCSFIPVCGARHIVVVDPVEFKRENAMEFGATHAFADADSAQRAVTDLTWGQLADHAICTVGVLTAEVVAQAAAITGKGGQVTLTSVGRRGENHIQLAANGGVVGYQRRIQGHIFGMCNPLYDIPRLLGLYRDGQ